MDEKKIQRINTLYHKSKSQGLTEEEKAEQQALRKEYIASVKKNLNTQMEHISIMNPDGTVVKAKDMRKKKN